MSKVKQATILTDKIKELERKLMETEAQLIHVLHFSCASLEKVSVDKMLGSGVILTLTALGGRKIIEPTLIANGLSHATIQALKADMVRSFEYKTEFKPKL